MFWPAFAKARFESVRAVGDAMLDNEIEQILVKIVAELRVFLATERDAWLKRVQRLNCAFEANRSRPDFVFHCRLGNDRANQVVRQNVCPDLLAYHFRRFAPQYIHCSVCLSERRSSSAFHRSR